MVAASASASQQQQQATAPVPSAEEEALKRNTDCVYFLASPLTCKKGSECEYRHSEYARINPRDCYFWLNRNCLNPKCGFRHPPLDGLFGTQAASSTGSSVPQSQMAAAPASYAPQNSSKQTVPCFYFQKGLCLKGEKCAFSHGPSPPPNKISQPVIPLAATEPPSETKSFGGPKKFAQDPKVPQTTSSKTVEMYADVKLASKAEISSRRNGVGVGRIHASSESMHNEASKAKTTNLHPVVNGNASCFNRMHQSQVPDDQSYQNGKDADEYLRESSPGFDVLVDDELRNSDFYRGEDQYGRTASHEGTNLNLVDEYDRGHSADYNSVSDFDRETFHDPRGYDTYGRMQGQYVWDQRRASSERMQSGPVHLERRGYARADSPEQVDADLRHHLRNQRRATGLRSVVCHDFVSDGQGERGHRGAPRRDSQNIGGRLHGRIKLPGRSSSGSDLGGEDVVDRGRNWGRLSPGRSQNPFHQGRLRDRIKAGAEENYNSEGRSLRGTRTRREMADDRGADFVGPKSLAELKGTKSAENMTQQSTRKRKQLDNHQPSEGDLSFDGPMPLSEILKRKREAGAAASGSGMSSDQHNNNQKESKEGLLGGSSNNAAAAETECGVSIVKDEASEQVLKDEEESKPEAAGENTESGLGQYSSLPTNPSVPETGDGMIGGDGVEDDQEYEVDEQREEDYDYEQGDEGEYYEEGENVEGEEEYADEEDGDDFTKKIDEDGDDFAKKIGVMFS